MFDLTSSKLLILGIVALIVVGPKELPFLLRTIGKYVGMIRRQATEFRSQFDEAMREAELDSIKKDLENVARDTENTIRSAQSSFEKDIHATTRELDHSMTKPAVTDVVGAGNGHVEPVHTHDVLNGLEAPMALSPVEVPVVAVPVPDPAPALAAEPVPAAAPAQIGMHVASKKSEAVQADLDKSGHQKTDLQKAGA